MLNLYDEIELKSYEYEILERSFEQIFKWLRVERIINYEEATHVLYAGHGFFFKFIKYDKNKYHENRKAIIEELKKDYKCLKIDEKKIQNIIKQIFLKSYDFLVTNSFLY